MTALWLWLFAGGLGEALRAANGEVSLGSALQTGVMTIAVGLVSGLMLAWVVLEKTRADGSSE
jgi:hypothetical protein